MKTKILYRFLSVFAFILVLSSCSKDDPCESIVCINGGECVNGECNCPEDYTGPDCSTQVTPLRINVKKVVVEKFPATAANGAGWDLFDGPDMYLAIYKGTELLYYHDFFFEDAVADRQYTFELSSFSFDFPKDKYTIAIFDYDDFDADDFMGGLEFTPYSSNNGFPETLNVQGGSVAFSVAVTYQF
jgi:hypothetical protein